MTNSQDDPCGPGKFLAPTRSINIRTEIPGPKSRALLTRYQTHTAEQQKVVIASAHGARVIDVDNNIYIDFASGTAVGHTHERVVAAVQHQVETADNMSLSRGQQYEVYLHLSELLSDNCPLPAPKQVALLSADAVDRYLHAVDHTNKVIRCYDGIALPSLDPADGAIVDETLIGIGRTGTLFAFEQMKIQPAAVAIKLTSEFYAVIGTPATLSQLTFNSPISPIAAAVALETLKIILDHHLAARAAQISAIVSEWLDQVARENPFVIHQHGIGAQHAISLRNHSRQDFVTLSRDNGLLLTTPRGEYIPLLYPLMIPEEQLYEGLDVLEFLLRKLGSSEN